MFTFVLTLYDKGKIGRELTHRVCAILCFCCALKFWRAKWFQQEVSCLLWCDLLRFFRIPTGNLPIWYYLKFKPSIIHYGDWRQDAPVAP